MNKRTVMASLKKIANELDNNGLHNEADTVTKVMSRLAYDDFDERDYHSDNMEHNTEDYGICPDCGEYLEDGMCADCGYGEDEDMGDDDMGFESEPFDYSSPEDKGYMHGDDMKGYHDKDSDF